MSNVDFFTLDEVELLAKYGWIFDGPEYIYIPEDYDGCMAQGIDNIRKVIESCRRRDYGEKNV